MLIILKTYVENIDFVSFSELINQIIYVYKKDCYINLFIFWKNLNYERLKKKKTK